MLQAFVVPVLPSPHPVFGLASASFLSFQYLSEKIVFVPAIDSGKAFLFSLLLASAAEEGRAC